MEELKFAQDWYGALQNETQQILEYKRFVFSWISLIFIFRSIEDQIDEPEAVKRSFELLSLRNNTFTSNFLSKYKKNLETLVNLDIENVTRSNGDEMTKELKSAIKNGDNKKTLESTIAVLYVVRCNLLHGNKGWRMKRDNDVMNVASPLLVEIVGELVQ